MPVEETAEKQKRYYAANRDKRIAYAKEWLDRKPPEEKRLYLQARYQRHKAKVLARQKRYQLVNRDHIRAYKAAYRKANRAKVAADMKKHRRLETPEAKSRRLNGCKNYRKTHLAECSVWAQKHRALKKKATVSPEHVESWWAEMRSKATVKCYWCQEPTSGALLHMDHVVPLIKGGAHSVANLCASCPACNLSKNAKMPHAWDKHPQAFLSL